MRAIRRLLGGLFLNFAATLQRFDYVIWPMGDDIDYILLTMYDDVVEVKIRRKKIGWIM